MTHKKFFSYFFVISFFVSFAIIPFSLAIVNDNDVNFDWITTQIYNENNPLDYEVSDSVNYVEYNNSDYFEHSNAFDDVNYTNAQSIYEIDIIPSGICWDGSYFYICMVNGSVFKYTSDFEYVANYTVIDDIYGICWDGSHFIVVRDDGIRAWKYDTSFSFVASYSLTMMTVPRGICWDGTYYTLIDYQYGSYQIVKYNYVWSTPINYGFSSSFPRGIEKIGSYYYIVSYSDDVVYKYSTTMVLQDAFALNNMSRGVGITVKNNDFYIVSEDGYVVAYDSNFEVLREKDTIVYYPEVEGLFDSVDSLNCSVNLQTRAIGNYQGTYSFENETGKKGLEIDYVDQLDNGEVEIISGLEEHNEVMNITATLGTVRVQDDDIQPLNNGIFELWIYFESSITISINLRQGSTTKIIVGYSGSQQKLYWYDSGVITYGVEMQVNEWYHIKVEFDCTTDLFSVFLNGLEQVVDANFYSIADFITRTSFEAFINQIIYVDAIGYSWDSNYNVGDNLQFSESLNGFWNEFLLLNETEGEILSIQSLNGSYYVNDIDIGLNIFYDNYSLLYDLDYSILRINLMFDVNQEYENGTIYLYNYDYELLFSYNFTSLNSGNVKYIKYVQYYQNTSHYVYISDFNVYSDDVRITGDNAFLSYELDLLDTTLWDLQLNDLLTIEGYGKYRFYVANDSHDSDNVVEYLISDWLEFRDSQQEIDVSAYDYSVVNPWLIVESFNGIYPLTLFKIEGSSVSWLLYDDRGYSYNGTLESSNIDLETSYFIVQSNRLYFSIQYNDSNLEYMMLSFDIELIDCENYQLLYNSYVSDTNTSLINQFNVKCTDGSYNSFDMSPYYSSNIETLNQNKIASRIEILISDDDLQDDLNCTGYIEGFTFNYSQQINLSIFIEQMLIMLIPLIIILSTTFGITYMFRDKDEKLNKSAFFPIFMFISIIVFILGFFDTWILFILVIDAIAYIINKRLD